jgi:hypothetical protein
METMLEERVAIKTRTKKVKISPLGGIMPPPVQTWHATSPDINYRDLLSPPWTVAEPEPLYIRALDVVSGPFAAEDDDEEKVYNLLKSGLLSNRKVVFSLAGIKMLSGFCSMTVGRLYGEMPRELLDANLRCVDMPAGLEFLLQEAIEIGILYQYDRPQYERDADRFEQLIEEYT